MTPHRPQQAHSPAAEVDDKRRVDPFPEKLLADAQESGRRIDLAYAREQWNEPYWPIGLCIAWVIERDKDRAIGTFARRLTGDGSIAIEGWPIAREELKRGLGAGDIAASGLARRDEIRVQIEPTEWIDLRIQQRGPYDEIWRATSRNDLLSVYWMARVAAKQMLERWPAQSPAMRRSLERAEAGRHCLVALKVRMSAEADNPVPKATLRQQFPDVSGRAFDRLYSQASGETGCAAWSKGGRRRRPNAATD